MSLINQKQFTVGNAAWVPLTLSGMNILRVWFDFTADIKMRSDPTDATTEVTLLFANGPRYLLPLTGPLALSLTTTLIYLESVAGSQTVILSYLLAP